jgi:DNA-binding NtrC family response regulator
LIEVPSEMERQYRRFLIGRGDAVGALFSCLEGEEGGSRASAALVLSRIFLVRGSMALAGSFLGLSASFFREGRAGEAPLGMWVNRALILWGRGENSAAERILRRLVDLSVRRDDTSAASKAASNLSMILARTGRCDEAAAFNGMAETCYRASGYREGLVRVELTKALIEGTMGHPDKAVDRITQVLIGSRDEMFERERIAGALLLAEMFLAMDDLERARDALGAAAASRRALGRFRPLHVRMLVLRNLYHAKRGERAQADRVLHVLERMREGLGLGGIEYEPVSCTPKRYMPRTERAARLAPCEMPSGRWGVLRPGTGGNTPFITADPVLRLLLEEMERAAPLSVPVLLRGETGVGKELIAELIHERSGRRREPFVPINAAALTRELFESTLFGHLRGAFTGAAASRRGLIESAGAGTVFLDEIAELDISLQAKLLRLLDRGEYIPLGGDTVRFSRARIITATNRDLEALVKTGGFRDDLYFRLSVLTFTIPPLRQRKRDVALLARHFLSRAAVRHGLGPFTIEHGTLEVLASYHWPGNARELESEVLRAAIKARTGPIRPSHLSGRLLRSLSMRRGVDEEELDRKLMVFERGEIEQALRDARGNRSAAARILGLRRTTLIYRMRRLGIDSFDE